MTLAIVRSIDPSIGYLEHAAEMLANRCTDPTTPGWSCAFHHALDLLAYARGLRTTTRCMADYQPNEIERRVEAVLLDRGVCRGMRRQA